jgi:nitrate reductase beta subunit
MKKLMAVRYYKRSLDMGDVDVVSINRMMREANLTPKEAEEIYALTALPTVDDRFVLPPLQREEAVSGTCNPEICKGSCGLGISVTPERGP